MVCTIVSCYLEGGCNSFMYNFEHVPDLFQDEDEIVFVSMGPHASITLGLGDAEEIICDARCSCQPLIADDDGTCQLAPVTDRPSAGPTLSLPPSYSPSRSPTIAPTVTPSSKPSLRPSSSPTSSPSLQPSTSPTFAPSDSPTLLPTMFSPIPKLLQKVSGSVIFNSESPQSKAVNWLVQNDNLDYDPTTQTSKLHQRYALVALDFAFHGNRDESPLNWTDPNVDECLWDGVSCATFDGIPHVRNINWARRNLTGIPLPEFSLFPALENLDLAQNDLQGPLDPFYSLQYLKNLYLFDNRFSGSIKDDITKLDRLERLYLGKNELTGTLSSGLWQEDKDRRLRKWVSDIAKCLLFDFLTQQLLSLIFCHHRHSIFHTEWLVLHHNHFNGSLPLGMRLGHLRYLDLSHNSFSSTIPSDSPTRLITMRSLYLGHNSLTGSIPTNFARIGNGWLKQFYANDNQLTGQFPQGWDPIYYITNIDIRNNQFTRDMPSSVCSLNVFDRAEMVELRTDCDVCDCKKPLCDNCR